MKTLPPKAPKKKNLRAPFGAEIAQVLDSASDCVTVAGAAVGLEHAERWAKAIRHVRLRELEDAPVTFELEPVHEPNSSQERRFFALLLILLGELSEGGRACTRRLFRGHCNREVITGDGEVKRQYVPSKSAAGLASRLGVSPRQVDRYLQVARSAGLLAVWQAPKSSPKKMRGRVYGFAVFHWLGDLPRLVQKRMHEWWSKRGQRWGGARKAAEGPRGVRAPLELTSDPTSADLVTQARRATCEHAKGLTMGFLQRAPIPS